MGNIQSKLQVKVSAIDQLTPLIKRFTLEDINGELLPEFTGGSHIIVSMSNDTNTFNNAYSLMSQPDYRNHYQICIRIEEDGKGGSKFMHTQVNVGDQLEVSHPNNLFALADTGEKHILIAGGIGITPFIPQLKELLDRGANYELHYAYRSAEHGALVDDLKHSSHADNCVFYISDEGNLLNLDELLMNQPKQTHVYVCGPKGLIDAVIDAANHHRYRDNYIHLEQFTTELPADGHAFTVVLAQSGIEVDVEAGQTILEAIEKHNIVVDCLCRDGYCGTCETNILGGEAEHYDQYLSNDEKASQQSMMICVSRAKGNKIVLDL